MAKRAKTTQRKKRKFTKEQIDQLIWNTHSYNIDPTHREIYLHGYHTDSVEDGEEPGVDYRMATIFEKNLNLIDRLGTGNILIHLHTCGGAWNDGMAIYDTIKQARSKTTILAYSHSRSMSSIIPMAATKRIIHKHTDFMIHYGTMSVSDRVKGFLTEADQLKKSNDIMLGIYVDVVKDGPHFKGWAKNRIEKFIRRKLEKHDDWYMTAEESVHYGFYHGILGSKKYPNLESIR